MMEIVAIKTTNIRNKQRVW